MRQGQQVYQEVSSFEQRLGELQSQLDRLTVSLQLWREQQDHLKPAEERLADLTTQCADIVAQWSATGDRQARAVSQLEERVSAFSAAEERLHHDAATRMRALERAIEQEWSALRHLHQGPVAELKEHASTLGQLSVAAANTSLSSIERTEARLAEIERTLNERLAGVSRQLEATVAEIRSLVPARQGADGAGPSWPIEGVVRLHNQLRSGPDGGVITVSGGSTVATPQVPRGLPPGAPGILAGASVVDHDPLVDEPAARPPAEGSGRRMAIVAAAVATVVVLLAAAGAVTFQRQARAAAAQAASAQQQAQAAVEAAGSQVAAVRDQAARELQQARDNAARAQTVSDVLASPDLIRFNISGSGPGAITGQVLWSRSRGIVFSALRVPPAPARMTYQLWLLTDSAPVTAGTFTPDDAGRVTFTTPAPRVPRPVTGAALTLEPAGGSAVPSDRLLGQNRVYRPAPAPASPAAPVTPQ